MNSTEKFPGRKGVAATIHFGDFRDVELSQQFDMVMSFGLIEHFDDPVSIVNAQARLCARWSGRFNSSRFCDAGQSIPDEAL